MPAEITDVPVQEVAAHIRENYLSDTRQQMSQVDSLNFAEIAKAMSNEKLFLSGLGRVNSWLKVIFEQAMQADLFMVPPNEDMVLADKSKGFNKLSRLLNAAANSRGWKTGGSLVLSGFSHGPDIVKIVKRKLLWKDLVGSNHGEFSHTIQWLILSSLLGGQGRIEIADLYSKACDYSKKNTREGVLAKEYKTVYLWDFLVDCLPKGGRENLPDWNDPKGVAPLSETPRSPSNANKLIYETDGFLASYLQTRYEARGWTAPGTKNTGTKEHGHDKHLDKKLTPRPFRTPQKNHSNVPLSKSKASAQQIEDATAAHIVSVRKKFNALRGYECIQSTGPYHFTPEGDREIYSAGYIFTRPDVALKQNKLIQELAAKIQL